MLSVTIRRRARNFGQVIRQSALTPRTGEVLRPVLAGANEIGLTFIGHSGFFLQLGGKNVVIDPNFARWLVPMHYGSFQLSQEPMEEPVLRLLAAARGAGVRHRVVVLEEGATRIFSDGASPR